VRLLLTLAMVLALAPSAGATPNMIRLGYPTCSACHLSPQGGGLLTRYGEGVDLAQSLRPEEPNNPEFGEDLLGSRLNYDARLSMSVERDAPADAGYGFSLSFRSAVGIIPNHRLVYASSVSSPTLTRTRTPGAVRVGMSRLYWLYQARPGLSFVFGRDDLPSGLGLPGAQSFFRGVNNPGVSSTPTQAKVFWAHKRMEVTAYGYGPDGNESQPQLEARGGGAVVGLNVWRDRAVVGVTGRRSVADAFDRTNGGVFARLALSRHWGILAEHDVTERTTSDGTELTHLAGHTQVFFVPFDWLQTALAVEHRTTSGGQDNYRLSPSLDVRLTSNIKLSLDARDVYTGIDSRTSRTYSFQLQVKTQ
jgi:hypothetical protein